MTEKAQVNYAIGINVIVSFRFFFNRKLRLVFPILLRENATCHVSQTRMANGSGKVVIVKGCYCH